MTSDMAGRSAARNDLDFILGKKRVSLGELDPKEFDEFLDEILADLDLRELRGFKTLQQSIQRRPGSQVYGLRQNPLETINLGANVRIDGELEINTHVLGVSRELNQEIIYQRFGGEETSDLKAARRWGDTGWPYRGKETILVLRRPKDHSRANKNLFEISYWFEKKPTEDWMEVNRILAIQVDDFRIHYGEERYPKFARDLIWEIASLTKQTHEDLKTRSDWWAGKYTQMNRIADGIME